MSESNVIDVGDEVAIYFDGNTWLEGVDTAIYATILGVPYATGDCWKVKTNVGQLLYIQQFTLMELISKENK